MRDQTWNREPEGVGGATLSQITVDEILVKSEICGMMYYNAPNKQPISGLRAEDDLRVGPDLKEE